MEIERIASYTWLMGVLGASISFFLAVYSIWRIRQHAKAEKRLVHIITREDSYRCFRDLTYNDKNIVTCRKLIKESSRKLDFDERKRIMEGLDQPSKRGQEEYTKKIVDHAMLLNKNYKFK